jgi:hypothetical protein
MIGSIKVENFRGIEKLEVNGLGRVNLIIGKNNSGKTALMEAAAVLSAPPDAFYALAGIQGLRGLDQKDASSFEQFWQLLFRDGEASRGLRISGKLGGEPASARVWQQEGTPASRKISGVWSLDQEVIVADTTSQAKLECVNGELHYPPTAAQSITQWISTQAKINEVFLQILSQLKQTGTDGLVVETATLVDPAITGLEILAPTGGSAALFVRLRSSQTALPIGMLGEGAQRMIDLAVSISAPNVEYFFVDEIENGVHHSVVESIWSWLAKITAKRGVQMFATTHSEECIQAAARAFNALGDDGLRVIRLDPFEHETRAVVYDRKLVQVAADAGIEIRG